MAVYLGFDSSTQSLTLTAISIENGRHDVLFERSLAFDDTLPAYGTRHGVLPGRAREVHAPPLMWAEAMDLMMQAVAESGIELNRVRAVCGAAQQHGSVYLADNAGTQLTSLRADRPLVAQIQGIFSRATAPVWLDASTSEDCTALTEASGGADVLARRTGSRAFERFTGPQIRAFARRQPADYARTERVHLVSSFMATLLVGRHAPVEPGDASGMNLMEIETGQWAPDLVAITASGLAAKLPTIVPSCTIVGELAPYWRDRYGYPAADVVAWSGDNPSSLIGMGLVREGQLGVSLGTSDTVFGPMRMARVDPTGTGHVFGAPTGGFMGLTCFANGSLARERIRDTYGLDWAAFSAALRVAPPGNGGALMLPWFEPEITPLVVRPGVRRSDLDPSHAPANVRAVVEAQMMAIVRHSRWMGVTPETLHVAGGAAVNREILQVLADMSGAVVVPLESTNAASLGAAVRAWHAGEAAAGHGLDWDHVVSPFLRPAASGPIQPRRELRSVYDDLMRRHEAFETASLSALRA
jgi:xylulokinase